MSVKTLYTCDKCGNVQETRNQFWTVAVVIKPDGGSISYGNSFSVHQQMEVCRPCLELMGIHRREPKPSDPPPTPPPTLEDLIREIAREEIGAA